MKDQNILPSALYHLIYNLKVRNLKLDGAIEMNIIERIQFFINFYVLGVAQHVCGQRTTLWSPFCLSALHGSQGSDSCL